MGGIRTGLDALQFMLAGASAVSVGTAVFGDPSRPGAGPGRAGTRRWPSAASLASPTRSGSPTAAGAPTRAGVTSPGRRRRDADGFGGAGWRAALAGAARCASASTRTPACWRWGLPDDLAGLERFALTWSRRSAGRWRWSSRSRRSSSGSARRGIAVLERTVAAARAAGALVLLDVKRGDIGSTMAGLRRAYLDPARRWRRRDHVSAPTSGFGSLRARRSTLAAGDGHGCVRAGADLQPGGPAGAARAAADGRTVAQTRHRRASPRRNAGAGPLGSFGVVVGRRPSAIRSPTWAG